jgi:branched-chain amino acid transport system permease protein
VADLLQLLIFGVVLGGIITLGAIGISLIFAILRFAHFAHGDLMTVGAYLALAVVVAVGMPVWSAFPFAIAGGILVAVALDTGIYRRLRRTSPVILLIASVGVALILRSLVHLIWGPATLVYEPGIRLPIRIWELRIRPDHIYIVLGSAVLVTALHFFLQKTRTGKSMRAMADDPDLAQITGINTDRVILWTWVLAATLAVSAGIFLGMDTRLQPTMGWHMLLAMFAAAIVGGIGRAYGAIAGGMLVGIATEMSTAFIAPAYKPAVAFAILVLTLIIRPTGLFAGTHTGRR